MTGTSAAAAALLACIGLVTHPANAGRLAGAPTVELTRGYHLLMVARAASIVDATHVRMTRTEGLHGETDAEVTLRADAATIADIEPGASYIVGYARQMKHPQYREMKVTDPRGPRILTLRHTGTRALFEDTAHTRQLFAAARADNADVHAQRLEAIVSQLWRSDARTRAFVIAEWRMRPELSALVGPRETKIVAGVLSDQRLDTRTRDDLLQVSVELSPAQQGAWLADACRVVVDGYGHELDLASGVPGLVRSALNGLAQAGDRDDVRRVSVHLGSNAPGVAKAALAALDTLDREAAVTAVLSALENHAMHRETKRAFEAYLREHVG